MSIVRNILLMICLLATALNVQAQSLDVMTQKLVFQKTSVTINEVLKELIYTKKINLSYSPDDLNLDEALNLPSKEIMIADLLKLISHKTGNKLIVIGSQIIIKKDRKVLPQQLVQKVYASNKTTIKDTLIVREKIITPLVPRASLLARVNSSTISLSPIEIVVPLTQTSKADVPKITNYTSQIKEVKEKRNTRKLNDKLMFGVSGGIGSAFLTNLADSGKNNKAEVTLGWNMYANILYKPRKKWLFETGLGLNHSNYSVASYFNKLVVRDSLNYDTISSQKINLKINNLEIPLLLNYYFKLKKKNIITGVGGSIQYSIGGKRSYTINSRTVSEKVDWKSPPGEISLLNKLQYLNRVNYCLVGQIGYEQDRWKILAASRIGLNAFTKKDPARLIQFSLSYTYMLF